MSTLLWAQVEIKKRLLLPNASEWSLFRGRHFLDRKVVFFNRHPTHDAWTALFNGGFGVYHSSHEYLEHLNAGHPVEYHP
jgi:hypothetical protein